MAGGFGSVLRFIWRYFKIGFGALLVLVSVSGLVLPKSDYLKRYENLEHEGLLTKAVVTKKTISESPAAGTPTAPLYALGPVGGLVGGFVDGRRLARAANGERGPTNTYYYIAYKFQAQDKTTINHKKKIDFGRYQAIEVGSKLSALYHPVSPRIHRLTELSDPRQPIPFATKLTSALIFGGFGLFLVWRNWRRRDAVAVAAPLNRRGNTAGVAASPERVPVRSMQRGPRSGVPERGQGLGRRPGFGQRA